MVVSQVTIRREVTYTIIIDYICLGEVLSVARECYFWTLYPKWSSKQDFFIWRKQWNHSVPLSQWSYLYYSFTKKQTDLHIIGTGQALMGLMATSCLWMVLRSDPVVGRVRQIECNFCFCPSNFEHSSWGMKIHPVSWQRCDFERSRDSCAALYCHLSSCLTIGEGFMRISHH